MTEQQKFGKFKYRIEDDDYFGNIVNLLVTYNGYQYQTISLPKSMKSKISLMIKEFVKTLE